jgi:hypothetical protein
VTRASARPRCRSRQVRRQRAPVRVGEFVVPSGGRTVRSQAPHNQSCLDSGDHESRHWRRLAAARHDELIARHPEAFADHAAEFWLAAGADPDKALRLARKNLEVRHTPRARALVAQAVAAATT